MSSDNSFDQIKETTLLRDDRKNRAKSAGRPPSVFFLKQKSQEQDSVDGVSDSSSSSNESLKVTVIEKFPHPKDKSNDRGFIGANPPMLLEMQKKQRGEVEDISSEAGDNNTPAWMKALKERRKSAHTKQILQKKEEQPTKPLWIAELERKKSRSLSFNQRDIGDDSAKLNSNKDVSYMESKVEISKSDNSEISKSIKLETLHIKTETEKPGLKSVKTPSEVNTVSFNFVAQRNSEEKARDDSKIVEHIYSNIQYKPANVSSFQNSEMLSVIQNANHVQQDTEESKIVSTKKFSLKEERLITMVPVKNDEQVISKNKEIYQDKNKIDRKSTENKNDTDHEDTYDTKFEAKHDKRSNGEVCTISDDFKLEQKVEIVEIHDAVNITIDKLENKTVDSKQEETIPKKVEGLLNEEMKRVEILTENVSTSKYGKENVPVAESSAAISAVVDEVIKTKYFTQNEEIKSTLTWPDHLEKISNEEVLRRLEAIEKRLTKLEDAIKKSGTNVLI